MQNIVKPGMVQPAGKFSWTFSIVVLDTEFVPQPKVVLSSAVKAKAAMRRWVDSMNEKISEIAIDNR